MYAPNNSRPTAEEVFAGEDEEELCEKGQGWDRERERERERDGKEIDNRNKRVTESNIR